jgi:hypothetical protein
MKADFFLWNNMLLAADAKSPAFLGPPQHPRAPMPELDENLTRLIDEPRAKFRDEIDRNLEALSRGAFSPPIFHDRKSNHVYSSRLLHGH